MRVRLSGSNVRLLAIFLAGVVVVSGPQIAIAAFDAANADKVDGRHAVASSASMAARAGKLVATNSAGRLPNNIIAKAPDSESIDGIDSLALQRRVTGVCGPGSMVTAVDPTGAVTCEGDDVDGGNAATLDGLDGAAYQQRVTGACAAGEFATSVDATGGLTCSADAIDGGDAQTLDGLDGAGYQRRLQSECGAAEKMLGVGEAGAPSCAADAVDGGNAQTVDGLDSLAFSPAPARTVLVRSGGNSAQNGVALRAALASIPSSGPTAPSTSNRWLLKVEPGIYQLFGPDRLVMRQAVDIEGSGPATVITCNCSGSSLGNSATVVGAFFAELRSVTVRNVGDGTLGLGIFTNAPMPIKDVAVEVSAATEIATGIYSGATAALPVARSTVTVSNVPTATGIRAPSANVIDTQVTAAAGGNATGIDLVGTAGAVNTLRDLTVAASSQNNSTHRAVFAKAPGSTSIEGSTLSAPSSGGYALVVGAGALVHVFESRLAGSLDISGTAAIANSMVTPNFLAAGSLKCVGAYDASFDPLTASCLAPP